MDIERIRSAISQMKLQDKVLLIGGASDTVELARPKLESVALADPDALSPYFAAEPSFLALGCAFSEELAASVSKARAVDAARSRHTFAGTAPCGLLRDPMRADGSGFFSEDPFLAARLLKSYASAGVLGYVFTDALGQGRFTNRTVDARALNELYLYPLAKAGKHAAALQLDGGYLNGENVCTSRAIGDMYAQYINKDAMIVTQYRFGDAIDGVCGSGAYLLGADGADKKRIARAVESGAVIENKLNHCLERTFATIVNTHEFYKKPFDRSAPDISAAELAVSTSVLLKNDGALPTHVKNMTIFGDTKMFDDGEKYSLIPIKHAHRSYGAFNVFLITDYENGGVDPAVQSAVYSVASVSPTVVVLCGACATPFPLDDRINALLFAPYCPKVSAVVAMLTKTAPRGRLPFSWCREREAYPCNNKKYASRGDFRYESVYNGHLLFDNYKSDVQYPFGHGLDYTEYEMSRLRLSSDGSKISVGFVVKNVGACAGEAVCQAYITLLDGRVYGISKRLAAFKRVRLEKTENADITLEIDLNDVAAVYDENNGTFVLAGGKYRVDVGFSSADIRVSGIAKAPVGKCKKVGLPSSLAPTYYKTGELFSPTAPEIERLLKVPFIKKPDERPDIAPPSPAFVKKLSKKAEKTVPPRLQPVVKYKISATPER
ncbi:MAG: fibronectin type III-like domain-contianing protein [Roseburia sp.]|nr:fibronectin type III-like domain-contianing protein [Roseburia sp.]